MSVFRPPALLWLVGSPSLCLCLLRAWDLLSSLLRCLDSNSEIGFEGREQKQFEGVRGGFLRKRKGQLVQGNPALCGGNHQGRWHAEAADTWRHRLAVWAPTLEHTVTAVPVCIPRGLLLAMCHTPLGPQCTHGNKARPVGPGDVLCRPCYSSVSCFPRNSGRGGEGQRKDRI